MMKKLDCLEMKRTKEIVARRPTKKQRMEADSDEKSRLYNIVTTQYDAIHYPGNIRKYTGGVCKRKSKWGARMTIGDNRKEFCTLFDTEDEAREFVIELNKKAGTVRNIIYLYDGLYYCDLNFQNTLIIISKESIPVVDAHLIGHMRKVVVDGKVMPFEYLLCEKGDNERIVRLNGIGHDLRVENLCSMSSEDELKHNEIHLVPKEYPKLSTQRKMNRNTKSSRRVLAQSIVMDKKEKTPENLALVGDLSEFEAQHEQDMFLWHVITTEGEVIYPTDIKKYNGNVRKNEQGRWVAVSNYGIKYRSEYSTFSTEEEATKHIMQKSIDEGLVKNIIYKHEGIYYCALTNNQLMLFSEESIDIIQNHVICAYYSSSTRSYYAQTTINGKTVTFHRLLCHTEEGQSVDHISITTLDNRLPNLRPASWTIQNINKKSVHTETGIRGVTTCRKNGVIIAYKAAWFVNGGLQQKSYHINIYGEKDALARAIALRKKKEETVPVYKEALCK